MIRMQKVVKVGNSLAVTLDSKQVQLMNIKIGQQLAVSYKTEKNVISLSPLRKVIQDVKLTKQAEKEAVISSKVTPEFQAWVERSLDEDAEAMEQLAHL